MTKKIYLETLKSVMGRSILHYLCVPEVKRYFLSHHRFFFLRTQITQILLFFEIVPLRVIKGHSLRTTHFQKCFLLYKF